MGSYIVYEPEEGWQEADSREVADSLLQGAIDYHRDRASDGWHEDAESIAMYRLVPVVSMRLERTATAEDDTENGEQCRKNGWDYYAELVEVPHVDPMEELRAERDHQAETWSSDHDDTHSDGALAAAAAFLAWPDCYEETPGDADRCCIPHPSWAYDLLGKHDGDRRRQLVIAAALIVAEIERLDRSAEKETP